MAYYVIKKPYDISLLLKVLFWGYKGEAYKKEGGSYSTLTLTLCQLLK